MLNCWKFNSYHVTTTKKLRIHWSQNREIMQVKIHAHIQNERQVLKSKGMKRNTVGKIKRVSPAVVMV